MPFDKDFTSRYMLPALVFLSVTVVILHGFGLFPNVMPLTEVRVLLGILFAGIALWMCGVCLSMMKVSIIRLMEGYGRCNPARCFLSFQKRRYARMKKELSELDKGLQYAIARNEVFPPELQNRRSQLSLQLATRFPDDERWILPTAFGNTIRAFEVYPRVMYGLESIQGWARLLAVIPKEYRELADETTLSMDFWVSLWAVSLLIIAEYAGIALYAGGLRIPFLPVGALALMGLASRMARNATGDWGEWVKALFDVFLPELRARLGLLNPDTIEEEQQMWVGFSQAIIYRSPSSLVAVRDRWHAKKDREPSTA